MIADYSQTEGGLETVQLIEANYTSQCCISQLQAVLASSTLQ